MVARSCKEFERGTNRASYRPQANILGVTGQQWKKNSTSLLRCVWQVSASQIMLALQPTLPTSPCAEATAIETFVMFRRGILP